VKIPLLTSLLLPLCAAATSVVGHLSSPTGSLPALRVYAWSASGRLVATATSPGQPTFHFDLPQGKYRFFATPADPGVPLVYAGYTHCMPPEESTGCANHDLRWIQVGEDLPNVVDVGDWHIDDAQAEALDRALHRAEGAGDQDPSNGGPRFFEFPARPLRRAHANQLAGNDIRPEERSRLTEALTAGHINFAGRATVIQVPCGNSCIAARIVDLETGRVTPIPTESERQGRWICPERLAYRRDSRLLRVSFDDADGSPYESYFVWDPDSGHLRPIGNTPTGTTTNSRCLATRTSAAR